MTRIVYLAQMSVDAAFWGEFSDEMSRRFSGEFDLQYYECTELGQNVELYYEFETQALKSDLIMVDIHGSITYVNFFDKFLKTMTGTKRLFIMCGIEQEVSELMGSMGISPLQYAMIEAYIKAGGIENYLSMAQYIANEFAKASFDVPEPVFTKWQCLYEPGGPIADEEAYLKMARESSKPRIGVLVHENQLKKNDMRAFDALHDALFRCGAQPIVLVTNLAPSPHSKSLSFSDALRHYFTQDGYPIVDAIINTLGFSVSVLSQPSDGSAPRVEKSVFELTNVPVLKALHTWYDYEQWRNSPRGLDAMMLGVCVYEPEYDGQIITFPISVKEVEQTPYGARSVYAPIAERVDKISKLACNWARLNKIQSADMKIAVILHNSPPRNDMIGCAHQLDTPESIFNMLTALENSGIDMEYSFVNGREIIDTITDGLTNDGGWLTEERMLELACDTVQGDQYNKWFDTFDESVKEKMIEDWGPPPGSFMAVDEQILIPGILNGNVFIGLQPPRAHEEKAEESYHSTDFVCPHQYIAFYKWVEEVFKADVIVHVGTHGTLEWLPGKEIGLSDACYPDLAIGTLPHLYIYNVAVTGEGMQAKRRSYATLIGHMVPSMKEGGTYGELAEMDELIEDYYHARNAAPQNLPVLYEQIWELAVRLNLHQDLNIDEMPSLENNGMDTFIEDLHIWISRIKESQVRDGLHILGHVPQGELFSNLCRLLVRVKNGIVPSLREAICEKNGLDLDDLIENPKDILPNGRTKRMLLEEVDEEGRLIFQALLEKDFDVSAVRELAGGGMLRECLTYVCEKIVKDLRRMGDETDNFVIGSQGQFIPPGPSGNPSRGNAAILPTGRNFYSMDPGAMPSRTAWVVGQKCANQMLERELEASGEYPHSVATVIYGGNTLKTSGEDLAEALYLMGARPVWLGNTDRVIGMEVIPLEELGRPRIDVVLRITGLFRDMFPNMIERLEDAVNMVAALDESYEDNYVRKHIEEEIVRMIAEGAEREQAFERASVRIFGCPPGGYGAGVDTLIYSKKWDTVEDLGNIYIRWSAHAYGKKLHGELLQDELRAALSRSTVTINNISSVEMDMFDTDDDFLYHGGLIAAIRSSSGEKPNSYSSDSSDLDHIETVTLQEETARVMRARINNPIWREGLMRHGYKGAQEVSAMVDYVFGWDATADNIEDWMYDEITKNFVLDQKIRDWINDVNPWAMYAITARLLEAVQRNMWNIDEEMLSQLKEIFMEAEGELEGRN
ncbi:MAG: cobaltochelatase subunit CobN [Oscillospiraceae bacterium]|nr:cobaltochelatase subunit CobN [Oscillospiraceae bacterium]